MIINIILGILAIAVTFLSYYMSVKNVVEKTAIDAINKSEDLAKIGEEKMKDAVKQVRDIIPPILLTIFTEQFVEQIIQEIFDKMKEFAEKQTKGGGRFAS
jgi:uncharacterized protein (UPF0333 family)